MYSATLSITSALDGCGYQRHPIHRLLYPREDPVPIAYKAVRVQKISPPLGFDPRTVHGILRAVLKVEVFNAATPCRLAGVTDSTQ